MTYGWMWLGILIASAIIEALTKKYISIWLAPSAILATVFDLCGLEIHWQIIAFFGMTAVGILIRLALVPKLRNQSKSTVSLDSLVGEKCVVTERIDNYSSCGEARVKGLIWSARSVSDDDCYEIGETLQVVAIEGVKLIVKEIRK